ncbi:EVI5L isoform 7, partial [Pan troglodytes]
FVSHLETELEQSRLRETETLGALREMQDKVLDMEKRNSSLPDENNVAQLQEELKALKVREGQAVASTRELKLQLQELSDTWQDQIEELKAEVRLLKGPPPFEDPLAFDGLSLARHLDEDSLPSSDEELLGVGVGAALQD